MKKTIDPLIPEELRKKRQEQYAELGSGGADLIKLDVDLLKAAGHAFNSILMPNLPWNLDEHTQIEVTYPLFENKDAIIYCQDKKGNVNFYYTNRETKKIKELSVCANTEKDRQAFEEFKTSFEHMETYSSRRSSNTEHQLIERIFKYKLHRDGIEYEQDGIRYRDSRTSFRLINAYKTCIRLCQEAQNNVQWEKAKNYWCKGVGKTQGEEMWLLQRICEKDLRFHPLPTNFDNFKRGMKIYNLINPNNQDVFQDGKLVVDLGLNFALYKGRSDTAMGSFWPDSALRGYDCHLLSC